LTILNAKARLCQYIGVVSKQPTKRNSNPKSKTGRCLSVIPSHVSGTIPSSTEFRDALMLRYARVASNLPTSCDGYGEAKKFDVNHALNCKKGGLVTARQDEIRDELRDLLAHVFSSSRIRCEPMINPAPMRANGTKTHVPSAKCFLLAWFSKCRSR